MRASIDKGNVVVTLSPDEAQTLRSLVLFCVGGPIDEDEFSFTVAALLQQELEKLKE